MKEEQVRKVAEALQISIEQAESLVRQEIQRKVAGKKYRESQAYKTRLEQQKVIRRMLKAC